MEPDPRPAIRAFREDLARAGIELVVVPVPAKASVETGPLGHSTSVVDPSFQDFVFWMQRQGIHVVDVAAALQTVEAPRYLKTDTHWRPHGRLCGK